MGKKVEVKRKRVREGMWVLKDNRNRILYSNSDLLKVLEEGEKYPLGKVTIEKELEKGACFL